MKRLALVLLFAVLLALAAYWIGMRSLREGGLGEVVQRSLAGALGQRVAWKSLEVELLPPRLRLSDLEIGDPIVVSARDVDLRLDADASLRERRPVIVANVKGLYAKAAGPSDGLERNGDGLASATIPPLALRAAIDGAALDWTDGRSVTTRGVLVEFDAAGPRDGRLRLVLDGVEALRDGESVTLERAAVRASLRDSDLTIESVEVRGPDLMVAARPASEGDSVAPMPGIAPTFVEASGEIGPIIEFFAGEIDVGGVADIELTLRGPIAAPIVTGRASVEQVDLFGAEFSTVAFAVHHEEGRWRATDVAVAMPAGRLVGDLALEEATWTLSGSAGWREIDVGALSGTASSWNARSSGDVALVVEFIDFALSLKGQGQISADGTENVPFDIDVTTDGERWSGSVDMVVDARNRLQLLVDRADSEGLKAGVVAEVASIERVAAAVGYRDSLPLRGGFSGRAACTGTIPAPECTLEMVGSSLRLADGTAATLRSNIRLSREAMEIDSLNLAIGGGRITATGTVALTSGRDNRWTLRADNMEVAPLFDTLRATVMAGAPRAAGLLNGSLEVRGDWSVAQASGAFTVDRAAVNELAVGRMRLEVASTRGDWRVAGSAGGSEPGGRASLELRGTGNRVAAVDGRVTGWPLAGLVGTDDVEIGGFIDLVARIDAAQQGAVGRVEASVLNLSVGDQEFGDSRIRANGVGGPWIIGGELLGGVAVVDGRVEAGSTAPFAASIRWRDAVLPAAFSADAALRITSSGEISAEGLLSDLAAADVSMTVQALDVVSGSDRLTNDGPIRVERDGTGLHLRSLALVGGMTRLRATGAALFNGDTRAAVDGTVDLGWLEGITSAVEAASGTGHVAVELIMAPGAAPQLSGSASVRGASFELTGLPPASSVDGDFALSSSRVEVRSFSADLGGGRVEMTGHVDLVAGPVIEWSVREVSLEPADRLELVLAGNGTLSGPWDKVLLAGDVVIGDLLYDRNLAFQDLIPSFDRAVAPAPARRDGRPPLRLNLRVTARDGMFVTNNIADLEGRMDLKITGSVRRPRISGPVEVLDGRVTVRGRTFEVITGVLTFQPEIRGKARIEFLAESVIESGGVPYGVQVRVDGMTDNFRVTLDSEDGLSQTDIASLITFGKTMSEMQDGTGDAGGISMDRLAGVAGGQVGKFLAGEVQEVLPFDEVELRAGFSPLTGEFEPQIRVGKYITEDLSAWIAQTFGVRSQTSVEMTYALTRQISTTLRWESQTSSQEGAFGGEVSQRFQFWRFPKWIEWGPPDVDDGGVD